MDLGASMRSGDDLRELLEINIWLVLNLYFTESTRYTRLSVRTIDIIGLNHGGNSKP